MDRFIIREKKREVIEDSEVLCSMPDDDIDHTEESYEESKSTIIEASNEPINPQNKKEKHHFCYVLYSGNYTYNGYTVDVRHRLRQHNGEITGGARATTQHRPWNVLCVLTSNDVKFTNRLALSIEWHIRYPTGKRPKPAEYHGVEGRVKSLLAVIPRYSIQFTLYCLPQYIHRFQGLTNCDIKSLGELL